MTNVFEKRGAWAVWWLVAITGGVYYFVWYHKINNELGVFLRERNTMAFEWYSQLIPFYGLYAIAKTADRVNRASVLGGSTARVGVFTSWFWAPSWFMSQTRYLQRRVNLLSDILSTRNLAPMSINVTNVNSLANNA